MYRPKRIDQNPTSKKYPPHILQALVSHLDQDGRIYWRHKSLQNPPTLLWVLLERLRLRRNFPIARQKNKPLCSEINMGDKSRKKFSVWVSGRLLIRFPNQDRPIKNMRTPNCVLRWCIWVARTKHNSTFALCEQKYKFFAYILPATQKVVFLSKQKKRQHLCNKQTFRRLDKRVFQNSHKAKLPTVSCNKCGHNHDKKYFGNRDKVALNKSYRDNCFLPFNKLSS